MSTDVATTTDASEGDYYITTDTNVLYIGLEDGTLKSVGIVTQIGSTDGEVLAWNTTTNRWEPRAPTTGALTLTTETIHSVNRARILLQANTNINSTTVTTITPASFQLNETGATIGGNMLTNLEGNLRFIVYPNLVSTGNDRTNFNCNFIVNGTTVETIFSGLYARNILDHRDTGSAIIFEYENAILADTFSFQLARETTNTAQVSLLNTSKIFIEQFVELEAVTAVSAPVDLTIAQGPTGPAGPTGPTGPAGPTISGPLDVYHAAGNINQTGSINYIQGANIIRNSVGSYTVTLTNPHPNTNTYPILITLERNAGTDDYGAMYTIISNTIFNIEIREQDDGGGGGVLRDSSFSFYVPF
ncbi:collagen-like protein [uncultured Winogradskyella sp.]|uniref:collagen-like triple helix repeat-containing protein n=1 Tax=uncultured Winogradskyella sp. TaxID=395353 RepID=UPI00260FDB12|nr:collagen-like protein [uncultured Winogradskyella sp.]